MNGKHIYSSVLWLCSHNILSWSTELEFSQLTQISGFTCHTETAIYQAAWLHIPQKTKMHLAGSQFTVVVYMSRPVVVTITFSLIPNPKHLLCGFHCPQGFFYQSKPSSPRTFLPTGTLPSKFLSNLVVILQVFLPEDGHDSSEGKAHNQLPLPLPFNSSPPPW